MAESGEKRVNEGYDLVARAGGVALGWRFLLIWITIALAFMVLVVRNIASEAPMEITQLLPFGVFTATIFIEWVLFRRRTMLADIRIFEIATFLIGIGIMMQYRMGTFAKVGSMGFKTALPLGLLSMLGVWKLGSNGRWKHLEKLGWACYGLAIALLIVMLIFGRSYRGGIYLPGNINPSEFIKPLLVVFWASFLSKHKKGFSDTFIGFPLPNGKSFLLLLLWVGLPLALVGAIHDLGLMLILGVVIVLMVYAVGRCAGYLMLGAVGVLGAGWLLWKTSAHVRARFGAWLHPFEDSMGSGWQILQGLSAMFAGGVWGAGIGSGSPQVVPIVTSDYVYAAVAEEMGLLLSGLILLMYACLFGRGFRATGRSKGNFGKMLALGLTASLAVQTLLNVAGVTKLLPLTGIVLPFLSQGGSGLVAMLAMVGLLVAISEEARQN